MSAEPLLGPLDFAEAWHGASALDAECWGDCLWCANGKPPLHNCSRGKQSSAAWERGRSGFDWIIAGGESGPKARPPHPDWFRSLRDQCQAAGVPFFFKQWGEWREAPWKIPRDPDESVEAYKVRSEEVAATHALIATGHPWPLDHKSWSIERDHTKPPHVCGLHRPGKKAAGATLDGREWREVPA